MTRPLIWPETSARWIQSYLTLPPIRIYIAAFNMDADITRWKSPSFKRIQPIPHPKIGEIHIFLAKLDLPARLFRDISAWLDMYETQRSNQLINGPERRHYVIGQGILRALIACYLQITPAEVHFSRTEHGKPFIQGPAPLSYNISHSGRTFIAAFAHRTELGIDIEQPRIVRHLDDVISYCFTQSEISALRSLPAGEKANRFFRIWVRKEAVIKSLGHTVADYMDRFSVPTGAKQGEWTVSVAGDGRICRLLDLRMKGVAPAALCSLSEINTVKRFQLSEKAIVRLFSRYLE